MRAIKRSLKPADVKPEEWKTEELSLTLGADGGEQLNYEGTVLRCAQRQQPYSIEFEFSSRATLTARLNLCMFVSAAATVKVSVNEKKVGERRLAAAEKGRPPLLHRLTNRVTVPAEPKVKSRLKLVVAFDEKPAGGRPAPVTILLGGGPNDCGPCVVQEWSWNYSPQAFLFFALAWFSIVCLAIIVIASYPTAGGTARFYAVLLMAAAWVAGIFNLPDLARIPLRPALRRLFGLTRGARPYVVSGLLLLSLVAGAAAVTITYCLYVRQRYSGLILKAAENPNSKAGDDAIRDAFVMLPWRKESQFLFERRAWSLRDPTDLGRFRAYVRGFVSDPRVEGAIKRAGVPGALPLPLKDRNDATFSDPVVWYASLLPEADPSQLEPSLSLLSARAGAGGEAAIQRLTVEMELFQNDGAKLEETVATLMRAVSDYKSTDVVGMHLYQIACDRIAQHLLRKCETEEAAKWYWRLLDMRGRQLLNSGAPLWNRPPDKLLLYYMFRSYGGMQGAGVNEATRFLNYCDNFRADFERFKDNHKKYIEEGAWKAGTVLDDRVTGYVSGTLLNKGWRY